MATYKCKMCGGNLELAEGVSVCECEYCGSRQTVPSADNEKKITLFTRAGRLLRNCEFDKAAGVFESIVADFPLEAEAYWGLILCKYGIEYVDDPASGKKVPTCHRSSFESVLDDSNFEQACENTDAVARRVYRDEARQIEQLRQAILEVSGKEEPYDVFISYKEKGENGERTPDSVIAQDIYRMLDREGYRVFFSRITLDGKLGVEYEPYIFAALNSAKVMIVVGTDYENFDAVWVKNEWNRFLKLIASGQKKTLIPVFKDMDAYDMPKEFAKLAALDMGKIGAMQDLLHGVDKLLGRTENSQAAQVQQVVQQTVVQGGGPNVVALLKRGETELEDEQWDKASGFFDQVLSMDAENYDAYFGLTLAEEKMKTPEAFRKAYIHDGAGKSRYIRRARNVANAEQQTWWKQLDEDKAAEAKRKEDALRAAEERRRIAEKAEKERRLSEEKAEKERLRAAVEMSKRDAEPFLSEISANEKIAEARNRENSLTQLCQNYDSIYRKFELQHAALNEQNEKKEHYSNRYASLSFFELKEAKQLSSQIKETSAKIIEITKEREKVLAQLQGYKTKQDAEAALKAAREETDLLEHILNNDRQLSYDEAIKLLKENRRVGEILQQREPILFLRTLIKHNLPYDVTFGRYAQKKDALAEPIEWEVLAKENNRILVISKKALECKLYNSEFTDITWEGCSLRKWLNGTFINSAFSSEEKAMIPTVTVSADKNPSYNTWPGKATQDKVFLLSITEAIKYFKSDSDRQCKPTAHAEAQGCYVDSISGNCWWWLRSPGWYSLAAARVRSGGSVGNTGCDVHSGNGAVRPALWINLGS